MDLEQVKTEAVNAAGVFETNIVNAATEVETDVKLGLDEVKAKIAEISEEVKTDVSLAKQKFETLLSNINVHDYFVGELEHIEDGIRIAIGVKLKEAEDFFYIPVKFVKDLFEPSK